jgi:hypothetical protein
MVRIVITDRQIAPLLVQTQMVPPFRKQWVRFRLQGNLERVRILVRRCGFRIITRLANLAFAFSLPSRPSWWTGMIIVTVAAVKRLSTVAHCPAPRSQAGRVRSRNNRRFSCFKHTSEALLAGRVLLIESTCHGRTATIVV